MKNIEVEVRSLVSKEQFDNLIVYFQKNWILKKEDYQETFYFNWKDDLRIQRNNFFGKIILKKWKVHDKYREEIEIRVPLEEFDNLEKFFLNLGYEIEIKWFRNRLEFEWQDITVCLDYTRWYGYIIEFEIMTHEKNKEVIYIQLKQKMEELWIKITSGFEFEEKFDYYKNNWRELIL